VGTAVGVVELVGEAVAVAVGVVVGVGVLVGAAVAVAVADSVGVGVGSSCAHTWIRGLIISQMSMSGMRA
jgi:hypothetical protein